MIPRCRRPSRRKGAKAPLRLTMRQAPNAIGSVTAGPSPCRWRRRHRHRPGRCRDVAAAAISWPHRGGIVIRDRSRRAWRDIGAAVRTQSWLWPGTRARRHRHRCRRRCRFKPLQFLPIELVGHVVAALSHCRRPTSVSHARPTSGHPTCAPSAVPGATPDVCACTETGAAIASAVRMAMPLNRCFMRLFSAAVLLDDTPGGR